MLTSAATFSALLLSSAITMANGDGVYSPKCSNYAASVSVEVVGSQILFTNNSGRMLAVFRRYSVNATSVIKELDNRWAAGSTFKISKPSNEQPFAYRVVVMDAAKMAALGDTKSDCEMDAWRIAVEQHLALCDQVGGSDSCRSGATLPRR